MSEGESEVNRWAVQCHDDNVMVVAVLVNECARELSE